MRSRRVRHFSADEGYLEFEGFFRFMRGDRVPLSEFHTVTIQTAGIITFHTVYFILEGDTVSAYLSEDNKAFQAAFSYYKLDSRLPEDWDAFIEKVGAYTFNVAEDSA